ncbi:venom prothrombin activator oscutarin-C non-catalytic subunit-like [Acropora millepora]|uniref:venom prothrombin activator oscutarin-C non-catalytic subunit-like n=1 Tax=Acropora millepora TaxID=45264 RepID=UPI001CF3334B|nr:venom prothrombin activator oscutarin-C non-catalytic subunit-like [Acropora millepora]
MMLLFWLSANFLISRVIQIETTNEVCRGEYAISGMFLKGHTFKTITVDSPTSCDSLCIQDVRCQSYNFIIGKNICELNNRTKEARPGDFVDDPWRFYMKGGFSRVPLGSIKELPAKSCAEIKASEGKAMTSGTHWIYSDENLDQAIQTTCEECQDALGMENRGVLDEQITASSELNDNSAAYQGRLNVNESVQESTVKSGAWVAGTSDQRQWLQVDLFDEESLISRVATQGRNQDVSWVLANSQWVERYKLQYNNDGRDFEYYHEQGKSTAKEFTGNTDENSIVFHDLNPPIRARYIRFRPTAWHQHISMRVELYGCCDSLSVIVCEGQTKEIRCESISKIRVLWANYGRLNPKTCPHSAIKTINCRASTSLNNMRNICQGKTACTLKSNSGSFGDPCEGTYKYLLVAYKCEN